MSGPVSVNISQKLQYPNESYYEYREVLVVLDRVGSVCPAVGVDDAVGDTLDHAVYRVTEVLLSRQHCGKQDEQRERDLKRQKLS